MSYLVINRALHGKPVFSIWQDMPDYSDKRRHVRSYETCFELSATGSRLSLDTLRYMCLNAGLMPHHIKRIVNSPSAKRE